MSTRRGRSLQSERDTEGQRQDSVYSKAQSGAGRKADGDDCPFPNKPVSHRSSFSSRTHNSLDRIDFENNSPTKQPVKETTGYQHRKKDLHRLPSEELQLAKAIHEKQLKLQEKLWRVEEKIKHKIQSNRAEAAAGHDEMKRGRGQPEWRQAQERKQVDVKQLSWKHDQQNEERMMNTYGEDGAGGKRGETEGAESSQSKGKSTQHKVSGELNKSRWESVKERSRRNWEEKDYDVYGEEDVRSQHGRAAQNKGYEGWTREEKYWERTYDEHEDVRQIGEKKNVDGLETENHRDAEHKTSRESSLPPDFSPSHSGRRQEEEEEELGSMDSTGANFQLFPCRMCNRMFARERLEKHAQICKKVKQSHRQVFNSYAHRTKGSALEEFLKTHTRSKTPEVLQKKNCRQNDQKAKTKTVQHGRLPAGTSQSKRSK
ncbi:hypothetical protein JOB18_041689 [Solea senegalensis]|uniref:C2HC/C3H-type domain-containing protein n=1 Tax=Solea senegalensis TaxID=28829 RepID=A0AAV6S132_SOLSE|nr:zinc finger C2HC domain-containing protein 1C [Solea senegalensis]XP_043903566.1 zinc finger C2HC domain-containing protein 1C [Solea senegalensis]KAG7511149.1 hypothetical protein JOB18_041689 [Solea senegalensis]KAG7511150.1 hypothetical protein JOB18_041689 [Solea senegalensis]KAG7511151.1 hypothetical protein JOB18_041689 [Solea senegalensis]